MTNPYGMAEVDIPGVLGAYEAGQTNRVRRMMLRQQMEAAERQAERDNAIRTTLARAFGGGGDGKTGSAAGAYTPSVGDIVGSSMNAGSGGMIGAPAPAAPASTSPGGAAGFRQFIPELLAAGMEPSQVQALSQLDGAQASAAVERWQRVAPLLMAAREKTSPEERRAYIQQVLPQVAQLGIPQQEIEAILADPSDARLDAHLNLGTTMAQALEQSSPQLMAAPQGGAIVGVDRRTGQPNVLYESPTIAGPNGEIYARPPAASGRTQPQTAINPRTGERLQLNPRTNQWEPISTQTGAAPDWPIPGGAASGQRPFP